MSLPVETQNTLLKPGRELSSAVLRSFAELLETAEKTPNVNRRDDLIATAVLSDVADKEGLADVVSAVEKSVTQIFASLLWSGSTFAGQKRL